MVLEMKRALEDLKKGADGAYRKIYDATYEEVYCKSLLITQEEKQALSIKRDRRSTESRGSESLVLAAVL